MLNKAVKYQEKQELEDKKEWLDHDTENIEELANSLVTLGNIIVAATVS